MPNVEVRRVKPGEVDQLQAIALQTFTDAYTQFNSPQNMFEYINRHLTAEKLYEELQNDMSHFYFACISQQVVDI